MAAAASVHSVALCAHHVTTVGAWLSLSALNSALRACVRVLCNRDSEEGARRQTAVRR